MGFHQTDNHPIYDLQPVTDTPEVKKAREEHERLWKAAARLNGAELDSNNLYSPLAERLENENYDDDRELEGQVSNQHQSLARYPVLPYTQHIAPVNAKRFGKIVDDSVVVDASVDSNQLRSRFSRQQNDEDESTSEPRGFFYKFDYPVPFIVNRNTRSKRMPVTVTSDNIDALIAKQRTNNAVPAEQKPVEKATQSQRVSQNIFDGSLPQDEVHDVQTNPKHQGVTLTDSNTNSESVDVKAAEDLEVKTSTKRVNRGRGSVKFNTRSK